MKKSILLIVLHVWCHYAGAQVTNTLTIDDGLSQNYIYDIVQDRKGFLWFGTKEGLNRYDGYSFVVYRNDPFDPASLSNNTVTALHEDSAGVLWVGTLSGGLNRFDRKTETFSRITLGGGAERGERINVIHSAADGALWCGTYGGGLVRYDPRSHLVKRFLHDSFRRDASLTVNVVTDITEQNGALWVTNGIFFSRIDLKTHAISNFSYPNPSTIVGVSCIYATKDGRLLVGHRNGVDEFDGKNFRRFFTANDSNQMYWTVRIKEDPAGNLYFATMRRLVKFHSERKEFSLIGSINDERFTRGMWIDRSDVVWVGTTGWGIYACNQKVTRFGTHKGSLFADLYKKELESVAAWDKKTGLVSHPSFMNRGGTFPSALRDKKGNRWLLSRTILFLFDNKGNPIRRIPTNPVGYPASPSWVTNVLYEDRAGDIWIGTVGGISRLDEQNETFEYFRLYPDSVISHEDLNKSSYQDITSLFQDRKGIFWAGTPTNGLIRFDPATRSVRTFANRPLDSLSLSNNHVLSICEDPDTPDSVLWIGTDGGGLNRLVTTTERFTSFTQQNGFPNNVVYGILSDRNRFLWMSTNHGLIRMNPRTRELKQYDVRDGLQSNEFNRNEYYLAPDGTMYFGGIYGYNAFHPEQVTDNPVVPNVVLTEFSIFNRAVTHRMENSPLTSPISETQSIVLDYSRNMFAVDFAALEFSAPMKNQYAYRLDGFNNDWIYLGTRRRATYTNLDPGEYTLRVKGSNGDGVWNETGTTLAITVLPPFWMTWWFQSLAGIAAMLIGFLFYNSKVSQLKKERLRQQEVSQMLVQSQEQERQRIAREMHDSLGQEMLVIKNRALMGLKTAGPESKERYQLQQITESASNVLKSVRELSHNLRPPELDRLGLTATLQSILDTMRETSLFELRSSVASIDGLIPKEQEINVVRIVQESMSNIVKYADAKRVTVDVTVEERTIRLTIADNGKGFAMESIKRGIGLAGISERVRIMGGKVAFRSEAGKGTTVDVVIPIIQ